MLAPSPGRPVEVAASVADPGRLVVVGVVVVLAAQHVRDLVVEDELGGVSVVHHAHGQAGAARAVDVGDAAAALGHLGAQEDGDVSRAAQVGHEVALVVVVLVVSELL